MLNKLKQIFLSVIHYDYLPLILLFSFVAGLAYHNFSAPARNDIRNNSVMIVNREMTHGGTGLILASGKRKSSILTNSHVCRVVKGGGIVRSEQGDYQVVSILESELSDLCLLTVMGDLKITTNLAKEVPKMYDAVQVSGHPALMPNIISTGHFSGHQIIQVMTGLRPCVEEDFKDPLKGLPCVFFGGLPVVRAYESQLVSATIMPGSSGSGVYNAQNELSGVVFAGSDGFGYGWIVPYEQVVNFLYNEHPNLKPYIVNQELNTSIKQEPPKTMREILQKCQIATDEVIIGYCNLFKKDMVWRDNARSF